ARLLDRGSLQRYIRATADDAVHLVPADFSLRHLDLHLDDAGKPTRRIAALLRSVADDYDVAIIDCPAGITLTSESVFAAVEVLLVPTIPTTLSQRTLDQLRQHLATGEARPEVLAFASMFDRRKKLQRQILADLAADTTGFLPTAIPNASVIEQMGLERAPLATYAAANPATLAFRALWSDIAARIWT
ncbi:MAG: ParA family protein, partial [Ilumatobacteraceae bacterium]